MCSYKLIEIKKSLAFLGCHWAFPNACCFALSACRVVCDYPALHIWGSFMNFEISSRWWLGALLFPTPIGCLASRKWMQPKAAQGRRGEGFSAGLWAELAMTDPQEWANREAWSSYKRPTAPCLKITQEGLLIMQDSRGLVNYCVFYGKMLGAKWAHLLKCEM